VKEQNPNADALLQRTREGLQKRAEVGDEQAVRLQRAFRDAQSAMVALARRARRTTPEG